MNQLETVDGFRGEFFFLSNMCPCQISYRGNVFKTSEHMYQWFKTYDQEPFSSMIIRASTGEKAKKLTRANGFPKRFTDQQRLEWMYITIDAKFDIPEMADMLIQTSGIKLVEHNWWDDTFFGVHNGVGENHLGEILMDKRERLVS